MKKTKAKKPKMYSEGYGLEKFASKAAMKKHEGKESKRLEKNERMMFQAKTKKNGR